MSGQFDQRRSSRERTVQSKWHYYEGKCFGIQVHCLPSSREALRDGVMTGQTSLAFFESFFRLTILGFEKEFPFRFRRSSFDSEEIARGKMP